MDLKKGFTLIELLVVIAIIGILVGVSFFGLQGIFENSRDTQRKSDLKQYQTALENYANKNNGLYPGRTGGTDAFSTLCGYLGLSNCPNDPIYDNGTPVYLYYTSDGTNNGSASASNYVIWSIVEGTNSPNDYWAVCSNGHSGTTGNSPSGNCPLQEEQ